MALDGALLYLLKQELFDAIPDARVERVYQPSKEELVLAVRSRAGSRRLLSVSYTHLLRAASVDQHHMDAD